MSIINLTPAQLRHAADLKEKIEHLQNELGQIQGVKAAAVSVPASKPARKKISAAGIARIRAAQKARWAKIKGAAKPVRKKISAAGIARIRAAQKARWAKIKGAAKPAK